MNIARIELYMIVAVLMLAAAFGAVALMANASYRGELSKPLVCFDKDRWGPAPDRNRPCVFRLFEDGSADIRQRDGGPVAANLEPND